MPAGHSLSELPLVRRSPFDPPEELRALRGNTPICPLEFPDGHHGWLVTGHQAARAVLSDPRFSTRRELLHLPVGRHRAQDRPTPAEPGIFPHMDPPEHTRYRRLLRAAFGDRRIRQVEPAIRRVTAETLDAMARLAPPVDLVSAFATPVPVLVICAKSMRVTSMRVVGCSTL